MFSLEGINVFRTIRYKLTDIHRAFHNFYNLRKKLFVPDHLKISVTFKVKVSETLLTSRQYIVAGLYTKSDPLWTLNWKDNSCLPFITGY